VYILQKQKDYAVCLHVFTKVKELKSTEKVMNCVHTWCNFFPPFPSLVCMLDSFGVRVSDVF